MSTLVTRLRQIHIQNNTTDRHREQVDELERLWENREVGKINEQDPNYQLIKSLEGKAIHFFCRLQQMALLYKKGLLEKDDLRVIFQGFNKFSQFFQSNSGFLTQRLENIWTAKINDLRIEKQLYKLAQDNPRAFKRVRDRIDKDNSLSNGQVNKRRKTSNG